MVTVFEERDDHCGPTSLEDRPDSIVMRLWKPIKPKDVLGRKIRRHVNSNHFHVGFVVFCSSWEVKACSATVAAFRPGSGLK